MMLAFVEGFNAAHAQGISAHSLRRAEYSAAQMEGATQARLHAGYSALIDHLVTEARRAGAMLRTGTTVESIRWQAGGAPSRTTAGPGA